MSHLYKEENMESLLSAHSSKIILRGHDILYIYVILTKIVNHSTNIWGKFTKMTSALTNHIDQFYVSNCKCPRDKWETIKTV